METWNFNSFRVQSIMPFQQKHMDLLLSNFYESPQKISEDSIRTLFLQMVLPWRLIINTVAFDNLSSMGIDLISNDSLRANISTLYGYEYKNVLNYQNITITEFREDFVPLLSDHVNIHKVLSTSELNYLKNDIGINSRLKGMVFRRDSLCNQFIRIQSIIEPLIVDIEEEIEHLE